MIVRLETDTAIPKKFFKSPEWDKENNLLAINVDRRDLDIVLLNLKEWVRQIELEVTLNEHREENND